MANSKKVTKRERFEQIKALAEVQANADLVEFIDHELELLAKKNASEKKATPNQVANEGIKDSILAVLSDEKMTVTDIQKSLDSELSNQKVSSLLRQLVADGKVVRVEDKRKAYFCLA